MILILASGQSKRMQNYCTEYPKCLLSLGPKRLIDALIQVLPPDEPCSILGRRHNLLLRHYMHERYPHITYLADDSPYHDVMGTLMPFHEQWKEGAWMVSSDILSLDAIRPAPPEERHSVILYVLDPQQLLHPDSSHRADSIASSGICVSGVGSFIFSGVGYLSGPPWPVHQAETFGNYLRHLCALGYPIYVRACPWRIHNLNTPQDWARARLSTHPFNELLNHTPP